MCQLSYHPNFGVHISPEVFRLVSLCLAEMVMCPGLRDLDLVANSDILPFYRLFLSPKLTGFSLNYSSSLLEPPEEVLSIIQSMVMGLDTFPLQHLRLLLGVPEEASRQIEPLVSSAVLRCRSALEGLIISSPLSDAAVQHIMQLPNLGMWDAVSGPPKTSHLPLSDIFPRLNDLSLVSEASLEWLTFLTKTTRRILPGQNFHSPLDWGRIQRFRRLVVYPPVPIDSIFMTPIMQFRGLVLLRLKPACSHSGGCAFRLTDNNIAEITTALPRLEVAILGAACSANSCRTTVASLVSFSTRCRHLKYLKVHFNMTNLRSGLESVSADPRLDNLPSSRTRGNFHLSLLGAPYTISEDDVVPVLKGFRRIFPSLTEIEGEDDWGELSLMLQEV